MNRLRTKLRKKRKQKLREYEAKYGLTSADFYRKFESGELEETEDFLRWRSKYYGYRVLLMLNTNVDWVSVRDELPKVREYRGSESFVSDKLLIVVDRDGDPAHRTVELGFYATFKSGDRYWSTWDGEGPVNVTHWYGPVDLPEVQDAY